MPPTIDIIRNAETSGNGSKRDPNLTSHGQHQAFSIGISYAFNHKISHVVSSPMQRCIRTAIVAFEHIFPQGKKVILLPELQDTGVSPYDTGQPPQALEALFPVHLDTSLLDRNWYDKSPGSKFAPDQVLVEERARKARVFLRELAQEGPDDAHIVVITHGRFAHFLTEDYSGLHFQRYTTYGHATMRSFEFVNLLGNDPNAKMVETADSSIKSRLPRFVDLDDEERSRLKLCAVMGVELQKPSHNEPGPAENLDPRLLGAGSS